MQPKIFQGGSRSSGTWTGPTHAAGRTQAQSSIESRIKRIMFIIAGSVFGLFVLFFIIGILNPEPQPLEYQDLAGGDTPLTAAELVQRGNDLFNNQEYDSAWKYYDRALLEDGTNMEAVYGKGIVLYQQGREEEAMANFRQSYEGGFRYAWLSWVLAEMNVKNGNTTQAISLYKESVQLDSSYYDSYKRLAELEPLYREKYLELVKKHGGN